VKTGAAASWVADSRFARCDLSGLRAVRFECAPGSARLDVRLPEDLLAAVKIAAADRGLPYQRYIRQLLEGALSAQ